MPLIIIPIAIIACLVYADHLGMLPKPEPLEPPHVVYKSPKDPECEPSKESQRRDIPLD